MKDGFHDSGHLRDVRTFGSSVLLRFDRRSILRRLPSTQTMDPLGDTRGLCFVVPGNSRGKKKEVQPMFLSLGVVELFFALSLESLCVCTYTT